MKRVVITVCIAALLFVPTTSLCAPAMSAQQPAAPVNSVDQKPAMATQTATEQKNAVPGIRQGNTQSRIFHNSTCKYYNCTNCTETFGDVHMAISKGYTPCKRCGG